MVFLEMSEEAQLFLNGVSKLFIIEVLPGSRFKCYLEVFFFIRPHKVDGFLPKTKY